jgi:hypothetical protein
LAEVSKKNRRKKALGKKIENNFAEKIPSTKQS